MEVRCPSCHRTVEAEEIALDTGWAKCRQCGKLFEFSVVLPGSKANKGADGPLAVPQRPVDARVVVRREFRQLAIQVPPAGLGCVSVGLLLFAGYCLAFTSLWTLAWLIMFNQDPFRWGIVLIAAITVLFWLMGLAVLLSGAWLAWGKHSVLIEPARLVSQWRCWFYRRTRSISRDEVQFARQAQAPSGKHGTGPPRLSVEIVHGDQVCSLRCWNAAEQAWLHAEIEEFLRQVPYDARYLGMTGGDVEAMDAVFGDELRREPFG